jgi:hypothetical protein
MHTLKPPLRITRVSTSVSEAKFAVLEERADASWLALSEWVRDMLFAVPVVPGPGPADAAVTIPQPALPDKLGPLTEAEMQALRVRLNLGKFENRLLEPTIYPFIFNELVANIWVHFGWNSHFILSLIGPICSHLIDLFRIAFFGRFCRPHRLPHGCAVTALHPLYGI